MIHSYYPLLCLSVNRSDDFTSPSDDNEHKHSYKIVVKSLTIVTSL